MVAIGFVMCVGAVTTPIHPFVCHQARTITPINVSPVFGDPTDSDRMEVAVDMAHTKPVEKHHKSRHSGRRESRHHHRYESPVSQPKQVGVLWKSH